MRKNLNKIISLAIGISIVSGSIIPAFAVDITDSASNNMQAQVNKNTVLTLDDVVNAAISNSDKLFLKSQEITMYRDKEDLQDKTNDFYDSIGQKVYDFPYDKLELQIKQTDQEQEFLKDQIASDITNKYNAIIIKQMDINESKANLEIKNKEFDYMKTKVAIGIATANQLDDKQIEVKSLQDDIQAKANSLKNNLDYLGVLTNLNLSNYTLDSGLNYTEFKIDGSIDQYLDDKIDTYFEYNNKILDLTKDYLKDLKDDGIKDIIKTDISAPDKNSSDFNTIDSSTNTTTFDDVKYGLALIEYEQKIQNQITAYSSYLDAKYGMEEARVKLDDSKKSLKNGLKESYATLLDLENKINTLKEQINSTNTKLKYAKSQVDMGMMTENDYKAQVLKSQDLDISLRKSINTYNNLKDSIEKPWVLSNN